MSKHWSKDGLKKIAFHAAIRHFTVWSSPVLLALNSIKTRAQYRVKHTTNVNLQNGTNIPAPNCEFIIYNYSRFVNNLGVHLSSEHCVM